MPEMMTERTDRHRPSVADPAEYRMVGASDSHVDEGYFEFDFEAVGMRRGDDPDAIPWAQVRHVSKAGETDAGCDHCGTRNIRHWVYFLHEPSGEVIAVGQRCASKLGLDSREEAKLRQRAERRLVAEKLESWLSQSELNREAYDFLVEQEDAAGGSGGAGHEFLDSLLSQARRFGYLSPAQVGAARKWKQGAAKRAEQREENGEPAPSPVVEGKIEVTGKLLGFKTKRGYGGEPTLKMLVLDDRGFKVWGTAPQRVVDDVYSLAATLKQQATYDRMVIEYLRDPGVRLRFTATVERSRDDETFGFFKRPTKAELLGEEA